MIVVVSKRLAIPASWKGKSDSKIITTSIIRERNRVPEFTNLVCRRLIISIEIAAFGSDRRIVFSLTVYISIQVISVSNHSKSWRECFCSGEHSIIPTIVSTRVQVVDTGVGSASVPIADYFVYSRMPVKRLIFHKRRGTVACWGISNILIACIWMKVLGTIKLYFIKE
jgi:hypothetical protein